MTSFNGRFILEKYTKEALRADHSQKGFAMIAQKTTLKGLRILTEFRIENGFIVPAGKKAYVKEETLHTAPWASKVYECDAIGEPFIIVDASHIEFIE